MVTELMFITSSLFPPAAVTPFSLFDDDDEEDVDAFDNEMNLKSMTLAPSGVVPVTGTNPKPSALLSEKLQVGEISLIPTDPT